MESCGNDVLRLILSQILLPTDKKSIRSVCLSWRNICAAIHSGFVKKLPFEEADEMRLLHCRKNKALHPLKGFSMYKTSIQWILDTTKSASYFLRLFSDVYWPINVMEINVTSYHVGNALPRNYDWRCDEVSNSKLNPDIEIRFKGTTNRKAYRYILRVIENQKRWSITRLYRWYGMKISHVMDDDSYMLESIYIRLTFVGDKSKSSDIDESRWKMGSILDLFHVHIAKYLANKISPERYTLCTLRILKPVVETRSVYVDKLLLYDRFIGDIFTVLLFRFLEKNIKYFANVVVIDNANSKQTLLKDYFASLPEVFQSCIFKMKKT